MVAAYEQVEALLDQIREKIKSPAIEKITDQISMLCQGYMSNTPLNENYIGDIRLTPNETSILALLKCKAGRTVSRDAMLNAASFHHGWDSAPQPKIIDVYICRMRKKLAGTEYRIENVFGQGYRLIKSNTTQAEAA